MRLSCASVRLEAGDRVTVCYWPAASVPLRYGEPLEVPYGFHAQLSVLHVFGRPAVVVELVSKALSDCFAAWDDGRLEEQDDYPDDPGAAAHKPPLPPLASSRLLVAALSRVAAGDGDSCLPLTGMSGCERHNPRSSGGRDEEEFNRISGGGE